MDSTHYLLPLFGILVSSQAASWASHRLKLPTVFGTLIAGLVLGPSVLGWIHDTDTLALLSQIGVLILMFLAGLDTDTNRMLEMGKAAFLTAACGVILPFAGGVLLAQAFGLALLPSLFVGAILTATSVSISARTLQELGRLQTREGTVILGAAVIDDVLGVVVLSIVIGMQGSVAASIWSIVKMLLFFPVALGLGVIAMPTIARWVKDWHHHEAALALVLAVVLFYAWASETFGGMAAVTGAYLAGLLVARTSIKERVNSSLGAIGYSFFIPLFFVGIGIETQARSLGAMPLFTLLLIGIAIMTKGMGCWFGARITGCTPGESLRIGVGMISRGEVALVIATLGLQQQVIDDTLFSATVLMTLVTTIVTPLLLKLVYALPRWSATDEVPEGGRQFEGRFSPGE